MYRLNRSFIYVRMKQSFWDIWEASPIIETPTTANLMVESTIESLEPIATSTIHIATEEWKILTL